MTNKSPPTTDFAPERCSAARSAPSPAPGISPSDELSSESTIGVSRRRLLGAGLTTAAALGLIGNRRERLARAAEIPDVEVALRAAPAEVVLDPASGRRAEVWRFDGRLLKGPPDSLAPSSDGYLGPTFRVRPGQRVRVRFDNGLDENSIVHWHGLDVSQENDGHPRFAVGPGGHYGYDFQVTNRPATYWYHPHAHQRTGPQVYAGLAGLFIVSDGQDDARGLPTGSFDLPLVLQDRLIGTDGELVYAPNTMTGLLGDRIFVNGSLSPTIDVRTGSHRLRILNGSNARIYKLAWSDGSPITVIGSDGGLLAKPVVKPYVMLAPGERVELWADFGRAPSGGHVWLESHAFDVGGIGMMGDMGMMGGMGRGMTGMGRGGMGPGMMGGRRGMGPGMMGMGGGAPSNGTAMRLCRFSIRGKGVGRPLPRRLEPLAFRPAEEVVNPAAPRRFEVSMMMMRFLLNGRPFAMTELAPNERIKLGATEEWEFSNTAGGMMMGMATTAHPIHLHGGQFQIVSRVVAPSWQETAATMNEGLVDEGWKDTFLLMPGERVRIRVRFAFHEGLFLYHCHNLEHEDMGMMRNFLVQA